MAGRERPRASAADRWFTALRIVLAAALLVPSYHLALERPWLVGAVTAIAGAQWLIEDVGRLARRFRSMRQRRTEPVP